MRAVVLAGTRGGSRSRPSPDPALDGRRDAIVARHAHRDLRRRPAPLPRLYARVRAGHDARARVRRASSRTAGDRIGESAPGQRVVNTSMISDGTCAHCRAGRPTQCESRALFGYSGVYPRLDGGQAELVRVPRADRCLWPVPDDVSDEDAVFVADILPTGLRRRRAGRGRRRRRRRRARLRARSGLMAMLCAVGPCAQGDRRRRHRRAPRARGAARRRGGRAGRRPRRRSPRRPAVSAPTP